MILAARSVRAPLSRSTPRQMWLLPEVPALVAVAALLGGTLGLGFVSGALARPVFLLGCLGVGYLAWREGAARSVECAIYVFCFAPLLRRVADYGAGYDPSGLMLLGPLLVISLPLLDLRDLLLRRLPGEADLAPMLLSAACLVYGWGLSAFDGEIVVATTGLVKVLVPIAYGAWVMRAAQRNEPIIEAASRAFLIATPIMGIYGFLQYVNPWPWDRFWMLSSKITTIGQPEPYQVRVFGTMNGPASFATYSVVGLLLFGFCRSGWQSALLALPVSLGLLLSMYRTAWISLVVGVLYCAVFSRTRGRAGLIVAAIAVAIVLAAGSTEFGEAIVDRLATLGGSVSDDGSGRERLAQYVLFYQGLDESLFGRGVAAAAYTQYIDGEIMASLYYLGLLVGSLFIAALLWGAAQALGRISGRDGPTRIVNGAIIAGLIVQLPLAVVSSGEMGMLFWMFLGIATAQATARRAAPGWSARPWPPRVPHA